MADIIDIGPHILARGRRKDDCAGKRLRMITTDHVDLMEMSEELGTSEQWISSAIVHLQREAGVRTGGAATVSVAALHLVLAHIERLEAKGGRPYEQEA